MTTIVTDDRILKALIKRLKSLGKMGVKVGVLGTGKGGDEHSDGISTLELAAIQHLGSPVNGIPARPFITEGIKAGRKDQKKVSAGIMRRLLASKSYSNTQAMDTLGVWAASQVKKHVISGPPMKPPNAQSTVNKKGSSRPLVDTGRMINSVTHEVIKNVSD